MKPITVWFNKNLSGIYNVLELFRAAPPEPLLRLVVTHTTGDFPAYQLADVHEREPRGLGGDRYVDWCLDFARRHAVDVFVPGKELRPIVRQRRRFEEWGVKLVSAADAETLTLLDSKTTLYRTLGPELVPIPDYEAVTTLEQFDAAYARLAGRHRGVCFKPAVSVYGLGFHVLSAEGSSVGRLLGGGHKMPVSEARRILGESPTFRELLVMQYLPGPERSVDCLGRDGQLMRCVVRRKPLDGYVQVIEDNPAIEELTRRLTVRLRLGGVFNVQFRDDGGVPYLLEINPRMSGGIHYACLSGCALPYWAVRLALGDVDETAIPQPTTGLRVGQVNRAVLL